MITKLLVIALLPVIFIHADETTTLKPVDLKSSTGIFGIRTPTVTWDSERRGTSAISPNRPVSDGRSNRTELDFQLTQGGTKSITYYNSDQFIGQPIIRNGTYGQDYLVAKNNTVIVFRQRKKIEQQSQNEGKEKPMGFINFDSDINSFDTAKGDGDKYIKSSPSLNTIFGTIFPESIAVMFRSSYGTDPPNSKEQVTVDESRTLNAAESKTVSIVAPASSIPTPLQLEWSSPTVASVNETNETNLRHVSREDIDDINNAKMPVFKEKDDSSFVEEINTDKGNENDYEDVNLNINEDNLIGSSMKISNKLLHPSFNPIQDHTGSGSSPETQINLTIIPDEPESYDEKPNSSPARQLDEFQEEVEKQFDPNDASQKIQTEASSRNFLKSFKEGPLRMWQKYRNEISTKLKPIQPDSLLHTYIYSSQSKNNTPFNSYSTNKQSSVAPLAPNGKEGVELQYQSMPRNIPQPPYNNTHSHLDRPEYNRLVQTSLRQPVHGTQQDNQASQNREEKEIPALHTDVFYSNLPSDFYITHRPFEETNRYKDGDSTSQPEYNRLIPTPLRQQTQPVHGTQQDNQPLENREAKEISALHTDVFTSNLDSNFYITHRPLKQTDSYRDFDSISNPEYNRFLETPLRQQTQPVYGTEQDNQESENQETKEISAPHTDVYSSNFQNNFYVTHRPLEETSSYKDSGRHYSEVEIQKSVNTHNKFITEYNGNLIEQHEIYARPETDDRSASLSNHPIKVEHGDETHKSVITGEPQNIRQEERQEEELSNTHNVAGKPTFPMAHIVEKQVGIPYPVREFVEKIVPVDRFVERSVPIPYPVQVNHFVDRPYAVQVPVAVPVPVPIHRYLDRPYPVEKIVEKPIHVPYPVERVVEKVVERHVPVEVEKIIEKPVEKIVQKYVDRPYPKKQIIVHPIHIPVPVAIPVGIERTKSKDAIKNNNFVELVTPPLSAAHGQADYKTLPENIDILLLDDNYEHMPEANQFFQWSQLGKRDTKNHHPKRSPKLGRISRVEYGFKPPIVPSLEIDMQGMPVAEKESGN